MSATVEGIPRAAALPSRARDVPRLAPDRRRPISPRLQADKMATKELHLVTLLRMLPNRPTINDIMAEFEVTSRTVRRYIEVLRDRMGIPITNVRGRYELPPGYEAADFLMSKKMALAVETLELLADSIGYGILGPTIERLREEMPGAAAKRAMPFLARFDSIELTPEEQATYSTLEAAEASTRSVRFTYSDRKDKITRRHVDPWSFIGTNGALILVAYDRDKRAIRRFDLSTISDVQLQPSMFSRPTREALEKIGAHSISGLYDETPINVTVRFDYSLTKQVRRQRPLRNALSKQCLLDGGLEAVVPVPNLPEFVHWLLGCGPGAEIVAPDEARDAVRHAATTIAHLHYRHEAA